MKIEIDGLYAPEEYELLAEFFTKSAALARARYDKRMASYKAEIVGAGTSNPVEETTPAPSDETEAPAKRKRRTKAEIEADKAAEAAPVEEPAQNISASPEDRQEPADPEDAPEAEEARGDFFDEKPAEQDDMIDGYAITDQGLQAVMHAYVAKFDMAAAQKNAKTLFGGFNKRSEVAAAGEDALRTAIANFARAISSGKEV